MSKLILTNEKVLDILPYFAQIGETLSDEIQGALKDSGNPTLAFAMVVLKNIKKVKKEIYLIVSEVTEKPVEEVKAMNVIVTIKIFKELLSNEGIAEIINFTAGQSSTD
jgi:hypothetical protein